MILMFDKYFLLMFLINDIKIYLSFVVIIFLLLYQSKKNLVGVLFGKFNICSYLIFILSYKYLNINMIICLYINLFFIYNVHASR